MTDIEIEIDGQKLTAKPNQMVIEVADAAGIYIPRFCYHKNLSIAANCRMCLVEVEKSPKTLPACATPVMQGMKVFTKSPKTIEAQRAVMEFLLINHPLDCPICDQGGECELQDISMGYGSSWSHYDECKRSVADDDLGPLIETEMTRCIQCTRCVRFGDEIAGMRELGVTYRGEHEAISTYVSKAMQSEISGNIIDLCPVGALTSKPYRFTARAWELNQVPSVSPHDCIGSNLNVHTRLGKVMRVVSKENMAINETWLSDRDRFSYVGLNHADRLQEPMARINGQWQTVSWERALELVAKGIQDVIQQQGADQFAALASPNATVEELYLLQKLTRGLGSPHVDHRLRQVDTRDQALMPAFPGAALTLAELEQCDAIILIGSNLQKEQPLAAVRLRKAQRQGATVVAINPVDYRFNFKVDAKHIVAPHKLAQSLQECVTAIQQQDVNHPLAAHLRGKQKVAVLVGALAEQDSQASVIRYLADSLAKSLQGKLCLFTSGANSAGAWLAGAIPHRQAGGKPATTIGLNAYELFKQPRQAYLLLNVEPELDCANSAMAIAALQQAKLVVALSMYRNPFLESTAHVILPIGAFTETAGTFVNFTGEWQSFHGVANACGSARPAWKVLRVLGNFLHLDGFGYESAEEVLKEVKELADNMPTLPLSLTALSANTKGAYSRIGEIPLYALDSIVRRSQPLQTAQTIIEGDVSAVRIHPETAARLQLKTGDAVRFKQQGSQTQDCWYVRTVTLDERIAPEAVWIAGAVEASQGLGDLFGEIEITRA